MAKIETKFRTFWLLQNLGEGWTKCLFSPFGLGPNDPYTFETGSCSAVMDIKGRMSKRTGVKQKGLPHTSNGPDNNNQGGCKIPFLVDRTYYVRLQLVKFTSRMKARGN